MSISYSAIVLLDKDRDILLTAMSDYIPEKWKIIAHHCTVKMGDLPEELLDNRGFFMKIKAFEFGINDLVCAVKVSVPEEMKGFMKNPVPHITLAVNHEAGGKPVMSNKMFQGEYSKIDIHPLELMGILTEIPNVKV